jgi:hypothetical protein
MFENMISLETLSIQNCPWIQIEDLVILAEQFPNLRTLVLGTMVGRSGGSGPGSFDAFEIEPLRLLQSFPQLRKLSVDRKRLDSHFFRIIPRDLAHPLEYLGITRTDDEGADLSASDIFDAVVEGALPNLRYLSYPANLRWMENAVTDKEEIEELSNLLQALETERGGKRNCGVFKGPPV